LSDSLITDGWYCIFEPVKSVIKILPHSYKYTSVPQWLNVSQENTNND
jgi:hypothetical protein